MMNGQHSPAAEQASRDADPAPIDFEQLLAANAADDAARLVAMVDELAAFAELLARSGREAKARSAQAVPAIYSKGSEAAVICAKHLRATLKIHRIGA
jgi:hypothetical protein